MRLYGCERVESNHRPLPYEGNELPLLHSAMDAAVGFEPRLCLMRAVSYHCSTTAIQRGKFIRSEPPRPHMKGNENRNCGWHSGDYGPFVFRTTTEANITLAIRYRYHNRRYWYQK